MAIYYQGSDLPDLAETWTDSTGAVIDFSAGYSFAVKVGKRGAASAFTKTTGITGASSAPNITIAWSTTGELNSLPSGVYIVRIIATRTSDGKDRIMQTTIQVKSGPT